MKLTKMKKQMILGGAILILGFNTPLLAAPGDILDDVPDYESLGADIAAANTEHESVQSTIQGEYDNALSNLKKVVRASKSELDSLTERPWIATNYRTANFIHFLSAEGMYSENTRGYYSDEDGSLDAEFIDFSRKNKENIVTAYNKLQNVKRKAASEVVSLSVAEEDSKTLQNWLPEGGLVSVSDDDRTQYYPARAWNRILDIIDVSRSGRIRNLHSIADQYGLISTDSGITKVEHYGRSSIRFVKDGVTYTYNCGNDRLSRISGSEKIKDTASKSHGVFWNILKGTMLTLATGAEIYRPFLTAKTNDRFLDGWENTALRSLDYGFPIPPYPVLQPIYPVNLTGIFKLWNMDEEQSSYDRSMAWFNQSPFMQSHMAMNPMAMNMAMQMQMRQRMMNPWGGGQGQGGPWGGGQNPGGGVNVDWNQLLQPLQYQTFAMSNWMNRVNEEIVVKRQQAENSMNNLRALEAATGSYQRLIPELMGVLNKLQTAQGQLNGANGRALNGMSNMDYSVQYRRDGGMGGGGFGGGNMP